MIRSATDYTTKPIAGTLKGMRWELEEVDGQMPLGPINYKKQLTDKSHRHQLVAEPLFLQLSDVIFAILSPNYNIFIC